MKEIVIISGKGGTGKTSITASLAKVAHEEVVAADCDVDAADMHLLLQPDFANSEDFYSGVIAQINQAKCIKCGKCKDVCRFDAISIVDKQYVVSQLDCEGCGYCAQICPRDAITTPQQNVGNFYISSTRLNMPLVHARLGIGAENSGKLVAKVKNEAKALAEKRKIPYLLVDGPPGIGCPVISSLSGADFVVFVTEPTISGLHDLERVYELTAQFKLLAGCIINKADLNKEKTAQIKKFIRKHNIYELDQINYDEKFSEAVTNGYTAAEINKEYERNFKHLWEKIKEIVLEDK
ncbi:MAG: ATP-binding protein [Candidatus Cloacimonadota bacterium]|nr:ATP-binding protein [Candidatus Cloacimonadota bacterium]